MKDKKRRGPSSNRSGREQLQHDGGERVTSNREQAYSIDNNSVRRGPLNQTSQSVNRTATNVPRAKKEAKKMRQYESNSIDEEEFQDCKYPYLISFRPFRLHQPH